MSLSGGLRRSLFAAATPGITFSQLVVFKRGLSLSSLKMLSVPQVEICSDLKASDYDGIVVVGSKV